MLLVQSAPLDVVGDHLVERPLQQQAPLLQPLPGEIPLPPMSSTVMTAISNVITATMLRVRTAAIPHLIRTLPGSLAVRE